ncbi:MAG: phosphoribosylglycinamide formyltransferase [Proteobacteria bacterium]|nr:phosphoribosylglycinamide formyltransferase [Pseudomonadota bacterium]
MKKVNLAFFASHGGSNMQAVLDSINNGVLDAVPVAVIGNNSKSKAFERAANENIPYYHLSGKSHPDPEKLDLAMLDILKRHRTNLVVLAGYMKKIGRYTLKAYNGRILNIHPALLPKFGGQGMYGKRVHEAVLKAGDSQTGVTIHVVDEKYDHGPIIAQEKVPVMENDTVDSLAERVLQCEHKLYSETIAKIVSGEIVLATV